MRNPVLSLAVGQLRQLFGRPDYWHTEAPAGTHVDLDSPRGYYLDYTARADYPGDTDENGVPVFAREGGRLVYNPPDVAQFALANLELYLESGSSHRREGFERAARALMAEVEEVPGSFVGWPMPSAPRAFAEELGTGWFSGMAHGECISVLARAATLLGTDEAVEMATRAMGGFGVTIEDGGLTREVGEPGQEGGIESPAFIEEYPMTGRPSLVLNGHVHAMWGIFDYARVTGDAGADALFDRCAAGLRFLLDRYDLGYWSRYDLDEGWRGVNPASLIYHNTHVRQLTVLHEMTGDQTFGDVARRWQWYLDGRSNRSRAYWEKVRFKLRNPDSVLA